MRGHRYTYTCWLRGWAGTANWVKRAHGPPTHTHHPPPVLYQITVEHMGDGWVYCNCTAGPTMVLLQSTRGGEGGAGGCSMLHLPWFFFMVRMVVVVVL